MQLRAGAASDRGKVRKHNEDTFAARVEQGLFLVCDGMGGLAAGEVASKLAIDTILSSLADAHPDGPAQGKFLPRTQQLANAVRNANRAIYDHAHKDADTKGMGTTIVGVWLGDDIASIVHVGDSRAYIRHSSGFEALTRDHSLVEEEVRAGILNRRESLHSEHQNVLLRSLGHERDVEVTMTEVPVQAGNMLLLCSDGLTRMVDDEDIEKLIAKHADPQQICDALVAEANRNGGVDNVTAVVVEVIKKKGWFGGWGA